MEFSYDCLEGFTVMIVHLSHAPRLMWNTRDAHMPQAKWGTSKGHYQHTKNVSIVRNSGEYGFSWGMAKKLVGLTAEFFLFFPSLI